ncbi:hypothetical protein ASPWEDRAFT_126654 [Aspergillus wentii DTO 134E9]|uniref:Oleate hydratase n=1 Tax=Aspergillus wentii DTO 134E9 TaxID=1073089 RepID=A0A1L9RTM7_ASPWE|nr:uncharacterized protein ASPWEDRAFT_126654 [Aspergillus wentii DTO 134E9]KAI9933924.1 hypothetical protein MW887_004996 [Aspergillus wentii]OJJ38280.1 hypothetical protein ASPWEDRAFT_126654 [Aspergillus wentii DTO 134E9]
MTHKGISHLRNPDDVQAWLIGSGIASLAAAVHLIKDADVPAKNIHILDIHLSSGGGMQNAGDAENGYVLRTGCLPYFHGACVEDLLSRVPNVARPGYTLLDSIQELERYGEPNQGKVSTRLLKHSESGPQRVEEERFHLGPEQRLSLIEFMMESDGTLTGKSIEDVFAMSFFSSNFWKLWSTTFVLKPEHSAVEFRRHLAKYLEEIQDLNNVDALDRMHYTLYESVIAPITTFLEKEGVDFRFNASVTDIKMYPEGGPTTVSEIELLEDGEPSLITVDPVDIVIATLGSMSAGSVVGSNESPPPRAPSDPNEILTGDWELWTKLSGKSIRFGDPSTFCSHIDESKIESFTVTLRDTQFFEVYEKVTQNQAGVGALVSFIDSNWTLSISVPNQPLFTEQPFGVYVVWGYGMTPEKEGNYVKKTMLECSGEEILTELLHHLNAPTDQILAASTTIPLVFPLGTSPLLKRAYHDRPEVVPHHATNIALVGQFSEIPDDTTFSMEYSVRGAQMAVYNLMGLSNKPAKVRRNILLEALKVLI